MWQVSTFIPPGVIKEFLSYRSVLSLVDRLPHLFFSSFSISFFFVCSWFDQMMTMMTTTGGGGTYSSHGITWLEHLDGFFGRGERMKFFWFLGKGGQGGFGMFTSTFTIMAHTSGCCALCLARPSTTAALSQTYVETYVQAGACGPSRVVYHNLAQSIITTDASCR